MSNSDFLKLNTKRIVFTFSILAILLSGCYGTFRTADVLKKGEKTLDLSVSYCKSNGGENPINFSSIVYRYGVGNRTDVGWRFFVPGVEFIACHNVLADGLTNPAISFQWGVGIFFPGFITEGGMLISKEIGPFSLYSGINFKIISVVDDINLISPNIFGGIKWSPSRTNKLTSIFLEVYQDHNSDYFIGYGSSKSIYIGIGFRSKIGT